MTEIAKAYVQIIPTTKGIEQMLHSELDNPVDSEGKRAGKLFGSNLVKVAGVTIAAGAATMAAAVAGTVKSVISAAGQVAEYGDEIDKMSQKMGVSATFYQEWDAVLQHSGTSMSNMTATFKTLANASQGASKDQAAAFQRLGLSMEQVQSMSTEQLFQSVIGGLQGMEEGTERTAIATSLLGRGAMEMGALLNTSAEDTQGMIDTVNKLGGVMSNDAVKAAASYQDSLQDMKTAFSGLKNNLISEFLPSMGKVMDGISGLVSGDASATQKIREGVDGFVDSLGEMIPKVVKIAGQIIPVVVGAIAQNVPQLAASAVNAVYTFLNNVTSPENVRKTVNSASELIASMVNGFIKNLPSIAQSGSKLVAALVRALVSSAVVLAGVGIKLVGKVVAGIASSIGEMFKVGGNLIAGLWNGIADKAGWLLNKIKGFGGGIINTVKSVFQVHSPSRVFAEIGGYMAEGLGVGWDDEIGGVEGRIRRSLAFDLGGMSGGVSMRAAQSAAFPAQSINLILNGKQIARAVANDVGGYMAWEVI